MKTVLLLLSLLLQTAQPSPLAGVRTTLRTLGDQLDQHRPTWGATAEMTVVKHQIRDWVESQMNARGQAVDAQALADSLHAALKAADLLCDECDWNLLGYLDDVRVMRQGEYLTVVTATGISCGYDESGYVYTWNGQQWQRIWEHEQNTYTAQGYLPQTIHDIQISPVDAGQSRLIMMLGSQTIIGGAFKNVYARAWRLQADGQSTKVLDRTERANDDFPPIQGRLLPGDVLFKFSAGGFLDGDTHPAFRHFAIEGMTSTLVDPIAVRPRDFVVEWLSAPWSESRARSDSLALEAAHSQLSRTDGAGDFPGPTLRCTTGVDFWQVATNLYEKPKRYFRVRWQVPYSFTLVGVSDTPYPDCTVTDSASEKYSNLVDSGIR